MKKLRKLTKAFVIHAMIFSLLQTTFVFSAYAQSVTGKDILGIAQVALGTYNQFLGQKQNSVMQQIQAQKNSQLMQSLSPSCRKADGTSCYTAAGKFFPECPLPATISAMPQNVCSETVPNPSQSASQISSMITYESIAKGWMNYYDQMKNPASNATSPIGLKCLSDKSKALDSQLTEMINNLTRLQDQLNKDKEIFKANNKKILEELSQTNDELFGAGQKNNLKLKTQDFSKYFSASCQTIIGPDMLKEGNSLGLSNVLLNLSPINKKAADYNSNRTAVEAEVRTDIEKIQQAIKNGGLQDYFNNKITETSKFQSLVVAAQKQSAEFKIAQDRIAKELAKLNYTIPAMDKNFEVDFTEFISVSQNYFKKQYINDCVTGADKSGIAISTTDILNSLQQKSTKNTGTARDKYRAALETILKSDDFIDEKLSKMKELEGVYKDISVTYMNSSSQKVTESPYDLYMKTLDKCEQRYTQDDQATSTGSNGVSQKKKVERGQALLRELKDLHDNYSSNLGSRVLEQVLSCNGETKKSGSSCGSDKSFDYTDASFCMAHANQCANEVNGCYAEANKQVETRKAKMTALAKSFNANAEAVVLRSNQLYTAQKNAVMEMVKIVQARFPGTNFLIPENMFITMPELKKDSFGVDLANDGNLAFLDELPKKIDSLKKIFKDQQTVVDNEIKDYIAKQEEAMNIQQGRWKELASECKNMIASVTKDLQKFNSDGMKAQAAQDQKVGAFCRKYGEMKENPLGACDSVEKLTADIDQVQARISNEALKVTGKFRNICNMYNNETEDSVAADCLNIIDDSDVKDKSKKTFCKNLLLKINKKAAETGAVKVSRLKLSSFCKDSTTDKEFIASVAKQLSTKDQDTLKNVEELADIEKKSDNLDDTSFNFFEGIMELRSDSTKPICAQLKAIDSSESSSEKAKKKLDDANEELKKEKETLKTLTADAKKPDATAQEAKVKDAEEKVKASNLVLEKEKLLSSKQDKNKENLKAVIAGLNPVLPTMKEKKAEELNRLGQQDSQSCDAQAANTNQGKNLGSSLLDNFDKAILGTSK